MVPFPNDNAQDFIEVFVVDVDKVYSHYWHTSALEIRDMDNEGLQVNFLGHTHWKVSLEMIDSTDLESTSIFQGLPSISTITLFFFPMSRSLHLIDGS